MIPYISIDIETTALDPMRGQILEIGAVYDYDSTVPIELLPAFSEKIYYPEGICGDLEAIQMNRDLLSEIHKGETKELSEVSQLFLNWVKTFYKDKSFYAAGKNFASFDGPWLRHHLDVCPKWKHRILDLGSMYLLPDDTDIPNLNGCLRRAGVEKSVSHRALDDAISVVQCIRGKYESPRTT